MNRYLILAMHVISLVLLAFGWILNVLHIDISVHYIVDFNIFSEKRSVLGMLEKLWTDGNYWPFSLIFIFGNAGKSIGGSFGGMLIAVPFTAFMNVLEILVAFLQAFIFTLLSALYIGGAIEEHHHAEEKH